MSAAPTFGQIDDGGHASQLAAAHAQARRLADDGNLTEARAHMEEAIAAAERHLGPDHPRLAPLLVDLGTIARSLGNLTEAQKQLRRALAIVSIAEGPDSTVTLGVEGRLAAVTYKLGEPTEALDRHLAEVGARVLGERHPAVRGASERLRLRGPAVAAPAPPPAPPAPGRVYGSARPAEGHVYGSSPARARPADDDYEPGLAPTLPPRPVPPPPPPPRSFPPPTLPAPSVPAPPPPPRLAPGSPPPGLSWPTGSHPALSRPTGTHPALPAPPVLPQLPAAAPTPPPGYALVPTSPGVYRRTGDDRAAWDDDERPERDFEPGRPRSTGVIVVTALTAVLLIAGTIIGLQLFRGGGIGAASSLPTDGVATDAPSEGASPDAVTHGPPTDVTLTAAGGSVILTWTDPSDGTVPFFVLGGHKGGSADIMGQAEAGHTSITIYALNDQVDYCFTVVAVWSTDYSATSGQVCTNRLGGS